MLKSIRVKNFYSIGAEQIMSLEVSPKDINDDSTREVEGSNPLNVVACIVGANASGKTTLLKALSFVFSLIQTSYTFKPDKQIPYDPHKLRQNEPSEIDLEFIDNGDTYRYEIVFNEKEILREYLGKKVTRINRIFELTRKDGLVEIKSNLKINDSDENRFKERANASLLSSLISTGYLSNLKFFEKFSTNVGMYGRHSTRPNPLTLSKLLQEDSDLSQNILSFSKDIDLGISKFNFEEIQIANPDDPEDIINRTLMGCVHESEKGSFDLAIIEESNGTQYSYAMLTKIYPILQTGGIFIADEIETSLHPEIAKKIVSLFSNKKTNPKCAQLIFSTHLHLLLNDRTKTQIFLAERCTKNFETDIYRLDDVEGVRNSENFFHKYLAGAYGGVPNISWI